MRLALVMGVALGGVAQHLWRARRGATKRGWVAPTCWPGLLEGVLSQRVVRGRSELELLQELGVLRGRVPSVADTARERIREESNNARAV